MKKKVAAPKLPKAPVMSRSAAALRIRTINENNVQRQKFHNDRLKTWQRALLKRLLARIMKLNTINY